MGANCDLKGLSAAAYAGLQRKDPLGYTRLRGAVFTFRDLERSRPTYPFRPLNNTGGAYFLSAFFATLILQAC